MPQFSIIMPTYNQAAFIGEAIDSILSQDVEVEVIVMDGGSDDGTLDILESYGDAIRWESAPDRGQAHAFNKGVALASATYLGWLNSDDIYYPGALSAAADALNQGATWVIGKCDIIDERSSVIREWITRYKNLRLRRWSYSKLVVENFISQPAVFLRTDVVKEAGGLDESRRFDLDYDLWLRIGLENRPVVMNRTLAAFRVYETSITSSDFTSSLRSANDLSHRYASLVGKPWLGTVGYWYYYRRTQAIYKAMAWVRRLRARPTTRRERGHR
jgi:glycosyltransferase involved in cell wall biosynthesis